MFKRVSHLQRTTISLADMIGIKTLGGEYMLDFIEALEACVERVETEVWRALMNAWYWICVYLYAG